MKFRSLFAFGVLFMYLFSFSAFAAVVYSKTNRLLVTVDKTNPVLAKTVSAGGTYPVYKFDLKNYAPKAGDKLSLSSMEFGYRSSDNKRDELSAIIVKIEGQQYVLPVKSGDQYFSLNFDQPVMIGANDTLAVTIYAEIIKNTVMAKSGDKFLFYLRDFGAGEYKSGAIIKTNSVIGKQSSLITVK